MPMDVPRCHWEGWNGVPGEHREQQFQSVMKMLLDGMQGIVREVVFD